MSDIQVKTEFSIREVDAKVWNQLNNRMPFQSHSWYGFGETVMSDCQPAYLLAYDNNTLIARACLWLVRNEPMPKMLGSFRKMAATLFKRWPLLISRSPLSYTTGLVIANNVNHIEIISKFAKVAIDLGKKQGASFVLFDYLSKANAREWTRPFGVTSTSDPGMYMENSWFSMDDYLASGDKKDRQHYKRVQREAEKLGIKIKRHRYVANIDDALRLIRNVEQRHGAFPNPWIRPMLEHMELIDGAFLTATIGDQLVGCGLVLDDNGTQMTSALGLANDVPYVYFMLVYESLSMAFEKKVRSLRWGSGAYDVKQRLGFSFEDNSSLVFSATNPYLQKVLQWSF